MRRRLEIRLAVALVTTFATAGPAAAQSFTLDAAGRDVVALSDLAKSDDCVSAPSKGQIVKRHSQPGRPLAGVTFRDDKFGEGYLNVPELDDVGNAAKRKRIEVALEAFLVEGRELSLIVKSCGAAGRVEMIDAITATASAGAAASRGKAKTKWRLERLAEAQHSLSIASANRRFGLSISCLRSSQGSLYYNTFFAGPRSWSVASTQNVVTIDGDATALEVDGADDGYVLSDATVDQTAALSEDIRRRIADGRVMSVAGRGKAGKPQDATFDISNGQEIFTAFDRDCSNLPKR